MSNSNTTNTLFGTNSSIAKNLVANVSSSNNASSKSSLFGKTNNVAKSTKSFMESNSLISKIIFLIIILFVFVILFRLGLQILNFFLGPKKSPLLINGMINGQKEYTIEVDPNIKDSKPIFRSNNKKQGIEFTYTAWIYIDNAFYNQNQYRHIFHKGDDAFDDKSCHKKGVSFPNNAPGVYIRPNENALGIFMNTYDEVLEEIIIDDLPVHKWMLLTVRLQNKSMDVYINGLLVKRHELSGTPRQNYGKIYCCKHGGFGGYLSNLHYFDYAINFNKIQSILHSGPNTTMIGKSATSGASTDKVPYLSMKWYYNEIQE